jgi:hypothetical protein
MLKDIGPDYDLPTQIAFRKGDLSQAAKLLGIWTSLACHFGSLTCLTAHFFHPSAVDCIVAWD